jgi:hypothetical protein
MTALSHLHVRLGSSNLIIAHLIEEFTQTPQYVPLAYPSGASASPLSEHGLDNLAIRDVPSAEEILRLLAPSGRFEASIFQRVLTATSKECPFDNAALSVFLTSLKKYDIAQIEDLVKEWAIENIRSTLDDDGRGVWWVITNLVSIGFIAIEDIIGHVIRLLLNSTKVTCFNPWLT